MAEPRQEEPPSLDRIQFQNYTLDQLALNTNCFAIPIAPFGYFDHPSFVRLNYAGEIVSTADITCPNAPTNLMVGETRATVSRTSYFGLVIGLAPKFHRLLSRSVTRKSFDKIFNPYKTWQPSHSVPESATKSSSLTVFRPDLHTTRLVVARIVPGKVRPKIGCYVPVGPAGLGYILPHEDVFLSPQYRVDSYSSGKSRWKDTIRHVFVEHGLLPSTDDRDGRKSEFFQTGQHDTASVVPYLSPNSLLGLNQEASTSSQQVESPLFQASSHPLRTSQIPVSPPPEKMDHLLHYSGAVSTPTSFHHCNLSEDKRLSAGEVYALLDCTAWAFGNKRCSTSELSPYWAFFTKPCLLKIFFAPVTSEEAVQAKEDWDTLIPDADGPYKAEIDHTDLLIVNGAVLAAEVPIEFRMIRYFLTEFVKHLRRVREPEEDGKSNLDRMEQEDTVRKIILEYTLRNGL
ncbi:hypothetical protein K461DRAFT_325186 [Myriangium duriaei CBS 260.36]|uniref:Uncharacterized protein n=1 Tax=Myriangium duriaei CBS 260.36 TaxID=1168546 RepID=A0A9P4ISD1_9PEZI|nr:hypothetical protein K461DRAFT_325186 [Myriangium duriaei CBS 260.36]